MPRAFGGIQGPPLSAQAPSGRYAAALCSAATLLSPKRSRRSLAKVRPAEGTSGYSGPHKVTAAVLVHATDCWGNLVSPPVENVDACAGFCREALDLPPPALLYKPRRLQSSSDLDFSTFCRILNLFPFNPFNSSSSTRHENRHPLDCSFVLVLDPLSPACRGAQQVQSRQTALRWRRALSAVAALGLASPGASSRRIMGLDWHKALLQL